MYLKCIKHIIFFFSLYVFNVYNILNLLCGLHLRVLHSIKLYGNPVLGFHKSENHGNPGSVSVKKISEILLIFR